jgi:hypothetical protein
MVLIVKQIASIIRHFLPYICYEKSVNLKRVVFYFLKQKECSPKKSFVNTSIEIRGDIFRQEEKGGLV